MDAPITFKEQAIHYLRNMIAGIESGDLHSFNIETSMDHTYFRYPSRTITLKITMGAYDSMAGRNQWDV